MVKTEAIEKFLEQLEWRYATKKFDSNKAVNTADVEAIKKAGQLAASSYGIQPYKVLEIRDKSLRDRLQPACWNQSQVSDASHLFLLLSKNSVDRAFIESYTSIKADAMGKTVDELHKYTDFVDGKMKEKGAEQLKSWTAKQAYIVLGNMMNAAAMLKIDTCPMEGFEPEKVRDILGLNQDWDPAVFLAVGYRSEDDKAAHTPKTRRSMEDLFETV